MSATTETVAHGHAHHEPGLAHHFNTMEQQREASEIGMWTFLVTEIMFFGAMFLAYMLYRSQHAEAFAQASATLNIWLGGINTAVLIISSLTMALAVRSAQIGERKALIRWLIITMILGATFLGIKTVEYADKFAKHEFPGAHFSFHETSDVSVQLFFFIYFAMTGIHALHMIIGIGILAFLVYYSYKHAYDEHYYAPVEMTGLYWHFVDIVWIFLFPLLYLIGRHIHTAGGGH